MPSNPYRRPGAPMCLTPKLEEADRLFPPELPTPSQRSSLGGTQPSSRPLLPAEPTTSPESPETSDPSPTRSS